MHDPISWPALLACAAVLTGGVTAQTLAVTDLVPGQTLALDVSGAPAGATAVFLASFVGDAGGPCYPAVGVCLDLLDPLALAVVPADGGGHAGLTGLMPLNAPFVPLWMQAVVVDFSTGLSVIATPSVATAIAPFSSLGDPFEGAALEADWRVHNAGLAQISVGGGALHLTPTVSGPASIWFEDQEGPLVYKMITGDFTATAVVHASNPANPTAAPPLAFRLGGLLARDPASGPGARNSVHVALGSGDAGTPIAAEDKTTVDSISDFLLYPIGAPEGELRLTRSGSVFALSYREIGTSTWQLLRAHVRQDLPSTLQVGAMVYSFSSPAAIAVAFDEIAFSTP